MIIEPLFIIVHLQCYWLSHACQQQNQPYQNQLSMITRRNNLQPLEEEFDPTKETKYCIQASREFIQNEKKKEFQNKLTFQYSLSKMNKEKIYGRIIETSTQLYPKITYENNRYCAHQYSSARIRDKRRSFILYKQIPPEIHKESIKKYTQILSKKKQKQGGLDSFWMFKKQGAVSEERKVRTKNKAEQSNNEQQSENRIEQAFLKILSWGKLPAQLQNGLISKNLLKNYITSIIGECFAEWFINFFQIRSYLNFKEFEGLGQKFRTMSLRQSHLVTFQLYDQNGDGFICPRDVFSVFERQLDPSIEGDVIQIAQFAKKNEGREEQINEQFKVEHVVIRDDWLTVKDYDVFFKKVDEPYLRATNKKDTGFSKSFAVLDHRQKYVLNDKGCDQPGDSQIKKR